MYRVEFTEKALKALKKLDRYTALLITAWIRKNLEGCTNPRQHGKGLSETKADSGVTVSETIGCWQRYRTTGLLF